MDNHEASNIFHLYWNATQSSLYNGDPEGSHCKQDNPCGVTTKSRMLDIQKGESAKMAALNQRAESMCASQKARNNAVLERAGVSVQDVTPPSPQPPAVPRGSSKSTPRGWGISPLRGWWISPLSDEHQLNIDINWMSPGGFNGEEDDSNWMKVLSGGDESPKRTGAGKQVVDGLRLQTTKNKVAEGREFFQPASGPSPRPPVAAQGTPVVKPSVPTPPAVPQTQKRRSRPGASLRPAKPLCAAGKKTASDCSLQIGQSGNAEPLAEPAESLSHCFTLLSSDDWMKKIGGLKIVRALVQHHSETLTTKLHEMCVVLSEEVKNPRPAVAGAAINALAQLYVNLKKTMDPEVEGTGRALLLKLAQTTTAFIHQQVSQALDAMVQNCSHGRTVRVLFNTGLSHRCVAVRGSVALHLHQVADSLGAAHILTARRSFTERFLTAVSKMSADGAPQVRHHGQIILQDLALHGDFLNLWTNIVPEKERCPLDKSLTKANK